mmetsp:Transcript_54075/g.130834  ORF Transcript_54075/g.130834 Transcript_54075/m.130834 type:complete len:261 (-) Transcript_54075:38-820(-)
MRSLSLFPAKTSNSIPFSLLVYIFCTFLQLAASHRTLPSSTHTRRRMAASSRFDPIIPLTGDDFEHVYEPAEDSFLFMDALGKDLTALKDLHPSLVVELGCGSGVISAYLAKQLPGPCYVALDINPHALHASQRTFEANQVSVELVQTDLMKGLTRLKGRVDVMLFNPPYVPTPKEEMTSSLISMSWAGGEKGREVTDRLLEHVDEYLSDRGRLYMVALDSNDPSGISKWMHTKGLKTRVVMKRQAGIERLMILCVQRAL